MQFAVLPTYPVLRPQSAWLALKPVERRVGGIDVDQGDNFITSYWRGTGYILPVHRFDNSNFVPG
ncbi:MAG TPA: hypothetical protein VJ302_07305 [Blastocatellia bacterium]|nr:hypothetical protein [Blastocatellia bacterium]